MLEAVGALGLSAEASPGRNIMRRRCRAAAWRGRRPAGPDPLRHARIITDPKKLAQLYAEAEKRKQSATAESQGLVAGFAGELT
jgi:hypothetical protein